MSRWPSLIRAWGYSLTSAIASSIRSIGSRERRRNAVGIFRARAGSRQAIGRGARRDVVVHQRTGQKLDVPLQPSPELLSGREHRLVDVLGAADLVQEVGEVIAFLERSQLRVLFRRTSISRLTPAFFSAPKNSAALLLVKPIVWISTLPPHRTATLAGLGMPGGPSRVASCRRRGCG